MRLDEMCMDWRLDCMDDIDLLLSGTTNVRIMPVCM